MADNISYVQESWRPWDERYADQVIGKRNWQLAAGGSMLSAWCWRPVVWLSSRSH